MSARVPKRQKTLTMKSLPSDLIRHEQYILDVCLIHNMALNRDLILSEKNRWYRDTITRLVTMADIEFRTLVLFESLAVNNGLETRYYELCDSIREMDFLVTKHMRAYSQFILDHIYGADVTSVIMSFLPVDRWDDELY